MTIARKELRCLLVLAVLAGCESRQGTNTTPAEAHRVPDRALQSVASESTSDSAIATIDVERPKLSKFAREDAGPSLIIAETVFKKPKFYSGEMPLKYRSIKKQRGFDKYTVADQFEGWQNEYAYAEAVHKIAGIADGARAMDDQGRMLAEARLSRIIPGQAIEVEEFHYANDGVRFYCKSTFSLVLGEKTSETEVKGTKARDYFFLWPAGGF